MTTRKVSARNTATSKRPRKRRAVVKDVVANIILEDVDIDVTQDQLDAIDRGETVTLDDGSGVVLSSEWGIDGVRVVRVNKP